MNFGKTVKKLHVMKKLYILLMLISSICTAQNLNFTIDTAVDNGSSITETIVSGGNTFVLLIDHVQDVEELDNLGGGDLIFFLGSGSSSAPFVLSITRNGNAADFNLNGIDYDTLGAGIISVTNQNGGFISSATAYPTGAGSILITNAANALGISQININPGGIADLNNFGFHNINVTMIQACAPPVGTAVFASQNCGIGEFFANINVTDLGGGTPSIFDGTNTTAVTATGVINLGPYPIGTPVNFTLQHGTDVACNVNLGSVADTCPPPCLSPVGTATLNSQDCAAETFLIDVNVTNLGSGSPIIFDGITATPVLTTGTTTLGPYPTGAAIPITIQHGTDASCDLDLGTVKDTCSEIIFTIDTAVDNTISITETIVSGGDTYVLTVFHSGNEELDNLGGGDLIFFLSAIDPLTPYTLSITRNGSPTNFNLNSIDYDTLGQGTISLTNQDDAIISNPTSYNIGNGTLVISNPANALSISEVKINPTSVLDLNNFGFHNISVDIVETCAPPAATAVVSSQNCSTGEFFVDVNVTDLGNGSPSIFDGTTATPVAATGVVNLGPYPTGTPINFTLQHGIEVACNVNLGSVADTCPPPCSSPVATATLNSQDCTAETFLIDVNVTDLGSGSPIIFDGTIATPLTVTGITTLGPYPSGIAIPITIQHGADALCDLDLGTVKDTCTEIVFTIDTAVDNTISITETIVSGGDTYVLTVFHSGNEELDNLGGGDLIFFLSAIDPLTPYILSITKNGSPTNFNLNSIDYDTLGQGTISLTNQDDAIISNPTSYNIGNGTLVISNPANALSISEVKINPTSVLDLNNFGFHNISVDIVDTCAPPAATAVVSSQNCSTGEFFVDVNVTDLGNGSPSIFDGTTATPVAATGVVNLGPYPIGTPINFTIQHGNDTLCDIDLGAVVDTCPTIPVFYVYDNGVWIPNDPTGVSGAIDDINILNGDLIVSADIECNNLTIQAGTSMTIDAGVTMTTSTTTLLSQSSQFSSLILNGSITGTVNYERFTSLVGTAGTNDLAAPPLSGQAFGSFAAANLNLPVQGTLRAYGPYNTVLGEYENYDTAANAGTVVSSGVGYRAATIDGSSLTYTGTPLSSDVLGYPYHRCCGRKSLEFNWKPLS